MAHDAYLHAAQEDRCAPRDRITIPASLRPSGGRGFRTELRDISTSGFCAVAVSRMAPGTLCWLTLPGMETLQSEVVWWQGSLVGCAFTHLLSPIVLEANLGKWRQAAACSPPTPGTAAASSAARSTWAAWP